NPVPTTARSPEVARPDTRRPAPAPTPAPAPRGAPAAPAQLPQAPTATRGSPEGDPPQLFIGDSFRLGKFIYRVTAVNGTREIGNEFVHERAGKGAAFVIIAYEITN